MQTPHRKAPAGIKLTTVLLSDHFVRSGINELCRWSQLVIETLANPVEGRRKHLVYFYCSTLTGGMLSSSD